MKEYDISVDEFLLKSSSRCLLFIGESFHKRGAMSVKYLLHCYFYDV